MKGGRSKSKSKSKGKGKSRGRLRDQDEVGRNKMRTNEKTTRRDHDKRQEGKVAMKENMRGSSNDVSSSGGLRYMELVFLSAMLIMPCAVSCPMFRCSGRRQGLLLQSLSPSLSTFVPSDTLKLGTAINTDIVRDKNGVVFVLSTTGTLFALKEAPVQSAGDAWNPQPKQLVELWQHKIAAFLSDLPTVSVPLIVNSTTDDYLLVVAAQHSVVAIQGKSIEQGYKEVWVVDLCQMVSGGDASCSLNVYISSPIPSSDGSSLFVCTGSTGTAAGACFCLDAKTGARRWIYNPAPDSYLSSPALVGDSLIIAARLSGNLHLVSAVSGQPVRVVNLNSQITGTPMISPNNDIYLCLNSGSLRKISSNGDIIWPDNSFCGGWVGSSVSSPVLLPSGEIAVVSGYQLVVVSDGGQRLRSFCASDVPVRHLNSS